jgi:hypothetical protein
MRVCGGYLAGAEQKIEKLIKARGTEIAVDDEGKVRTEPLHYG